MKTKNSILILILLLTIVSCKTEHEHEGSHDDDLHEATHFNDDDDYNHESDSFIHEHESIAKQKAKLIEKGFEVFDYVDEKTKDTFLMQKYFIAFLKRGPNQSQSKVEADSLQGLHMAHLGRMYEEGYADISGPFGDDGDIRGITVYNVPNFNMADSLANMDPMVKAGRLVIEMHPWWAAKGFSLR